MSGMATGGAAAPAALTEPRKITLDKNGIYTLVLTGLTFDENGIVNERGVDTNRRWEQEESKAPSQWFDNATGQWSMVQTAAPLPLNTAFHCKLGSESQSYVYQGALRNNRLVVRRVDAQGTPYAMEALHIVVQRVEAPNTIYAVLLWQCWQCFGESPEEMYPPSQFDSIMAVPLNEVDRSIDAWRRERRNRERRRRRQVAGSNNAGKVDRMRKIHLAKQKAAIRNPTLKTARDHMQSQCQPRSIWDVILVKATTFHRYQWPNVDARTLPTWQPNVAYGPAHVLQTFIHEVDYTHFYVWLGLRINNVDYALCVQVDTTHKNSGKVNKQTNRKALYGNLMWFTLYAVYAQGGHLPKGVSLEPPTVDVLVGQFHDNTLRLRF